MNKTVYNIFALELIGRRDSFPQSMPVLNDSNKKHRRQRNQHRTNTTSTPESVSEPGSPRTAVEHLPAAPRRSAYDKTMYLFGSSKRQILQANLPKCPRPIEVIFCRDAALGKIFDTFFFWLPTRPFKGRKRPVFPEICMVGGLRKTLYLRKCRANFDGRWPNRKKIAKYWRVVSGFWQILKFRGRKHL